MKNKKFYIISFLVPILIFVLVLFVKGFINGEYSILVSDMWQQYYGLFTRLKEILEGFGSLFYTYKIGLGQSFISTFAYYLASPLNLILYFFDNVENAMKFIITLKIGLCGFSMFTYLKYHFNKENSKLLLFSTAYALSLQTLCNYFNIMWLDAYYLSPLVLLGIDKFIDNNKSILYFITLFLTISINYYMGYMVCIFSVIYFIYKLYLKYNKKDKKQIKEKIIRFAIISILAGLSSMFINLPNLFGITSIERFNSSSLNSIFNFDITKNISTIYFLGQDLSSFLNESYVYFYFGLFVLLNLILYFFNKNINRKEKRASVIIIFILILSVLINPINNIWHVFNEPIGFNYRYYFLFLIVFILLACKNFIKLDITTIKKYISIVIVFLILGIIAFIFGDLSIKALILSLILIIVYSCILYFYKKDSSLNNLLNICLLILCLGELYYNTINVFELSKFNLSEHIEYREKTKKETLNEIKNNDDSKFYRIEFSNSLYNDSILYDYNSSTGWYSTINSKSINFFGNFGYSTSVNQYRHINLPILDSIMNIKYYVYTIQNIEDNYLTQEDEIEINPYYLELGYMVNNNVLNEFNCDDACHCQNILATQMSGEEIEYYIEEEVEQNNYEYSFIINNENDFIIRFPFNYNDTLHEFSYDIYLNGNYMQTITEESGFVSEFTNNAEIGTKINISIKNIVGKLNYNEVNVYYKDTEEIENMYNSLSKNQLNLIDISDGYIKGTIDVTDDKNILFLSIPYENGWKAKVDGEEIDIISIYDTFIGLELESGTHEIELVYKTPALKTGIIISIVSLLLYGIYFYFEKKTNK